ncbi:MAG: flagellar motor protein MotB [Pseudolabrys sp.]|nr:flagellar motor protein MotB [Pseudolabrys sp.]MDP2297776.1 flagellar motor protein MotB [Pseudolabrys sp.]
MAKKNRGGHAGGHGWFVTFADLMALLVAFFVMLVAFSTQDAAKLQVVAGSMRDAFGVQDKVRYSGVIEIMGLPTRPKLKSVANIDPKDASPTPAPDENDHNRNYGARFKEDRKFAMAAASLRQAMQTMPEITEASKHIMLEETRQGLNIEIVDQEGRSMFADGAKEPFERTRQLIQKLAPSLKAMPFRIAISGHTATSKVPPRPGYGPWELSADRANAVRAILAAEGVPPGNFYMVAGRADTEPLFPDNPGMSPNRRVTITLMREEPPIPVELKP